MFRNCESGGEITLLGKEGLAMKIAILMDAPLRPSLIGEKTMEQLRSMGEVCLNETGGADRETVKEVIRGAEVAITSWGGPCSIRRSWTVRPI